MPWGFIALYALFYGLGYLLALNVLIFDSSLIIKTVPLFFVVGGFLFLGEFTRRAIRLPSGRRPGRWLLLLPFTAIILSTAVSRSAVDVAIHDFLGAMVAIGAAGAFWQAGLKTKKPERFWMIAAGLLFLFQGLLFVFHFLSSLIGGAPPSFPLLPLLPPQPQNNFTLVYLFISGLSTLGIAFFFSRLAIERLEVYLISAYLNRKSKYYFYTSLALLVFIIVGGWFLTNYTGGFFLKEKISSVRLDADLMSDHLGGVLSAVNQGVMLLANITSIKKALNEQDDRALAQVTDDLFTAQSNFRLETCLLADSRGRVIASADLRPDRIISQVDTSLPFFADAISGFRSYYITFDQKKEAPIYWTAFPVRCLNGEIGGGVIMAKNIETAEFFLKKHRYAFHLSPEGIIMLTSHPILRRMPLWPLTPEVKERIQNSPEYGFTPGEALLSARPQGKIVTYNGYPHLLVNSFHQWPIYIMTPIDEIVLARLATILLLFLLVAVTLVFFIDSQRLLAASAQLLGAEKRFQLIFQNVPAAIFILDGADGKILSENSFVYQWLGYSPQELREMTMAEIMSNPPGPQKQRSYRKKDGATVEVEEVTAAITIDDRANQLLIAHDITEQKKYEETLKHLSLVDGLTGIANRRNFDEFFSRQWKLAIREGTTLSLIMGDIDFFKRYNDALGHQAGDNCLIQVAVAIQDAIRRPLDMVARYGGEEFIVVMPDTDQEGAMNVALEIRRRIKMLALPHPDSTVGAYVTMSIGVTSVTPRTGMEPGNLIAAADHALYRAKIGGRDRIEYMNPR